MFFCELASSFEKFVAVFCKFLFFPADPMQFSRRRGGMRLKNVETMV